MFGVTQRWRRPLNVLQELERARACHLDALQVLKHTLSSHPEAASKLQTLSTSDDTDPEVRAVMKCLLALSYFAMKQEAAELAVIATADVQTKGESVWVS